MATITATRIKGREIPASWFKNAQIDPKITFRVTLVPEHEVHLSKAHRNQIMDEMEQFSGDEDSQKWIRNIKSARTHSELKVPLA